MLKLLRGVFCMLEIHYGRGYAYSIQYYILFGV